MQGYVQIYKVIESKGADLVSIQENFDTSTAIGRAVIRIILIFAQMEREQTSERTIDVMSYRAKQGQFTGGYPRLGYDIDSDNKCLAVNESEVPLAREIFNTYMEKGSLCETAKALNAKGYRMKSWTTKSGQKRVGNKFMKNSVSRLLKDPIYIGKIRHKEQIYDGLHPAIIDEEVFAAVNMMLRSNNITKTGYRQDGNQCLLKGVLYCGICHSAMTPSFSIARGKRYYYYRCVVDNDRSKKQCRIGSVNARHVEDLVIDELKFLAESPRIIEGVVEAATKGQKKRIKELIAKKKPIQDKLARLDTKAKNLLDILGEEGKKGQRTTYILKELEDIEKHSKQIRQEIDYIDFEAKTHESKLINANIVRENFKVFRDVFDHLTQEEKYDLMHLLIKKVVYFEDEGKAEKGAKTGNIKMDLWELPSIDPSMINSTKPSDLDFAESADWLPGRDCTPTADLAG